MLETLQTMSVPSDVIADLIARFPAVGEQEEADTTLERSLDLLRQWVEYALDVLPSTKATYVFPRDDALPVFLPIFALHQNHTTTQFQEEVRNELRVERKERQERKERDEQLLRAFSEIGRLVDQHIPARRLSSMRKDVCLASTPVMASGWSMPQESSSISVARRFTG